MQNRIFIYLKNFEYFRNLQDLFYMRLASIKRSIACNQFVTIKQIRCVESRTEHVTFREGLTKCLKVNEVAYPLYFSTSFYTYPLYYRRPLHDRPDLVYIPSPASRRASKSKTGKTRQQTFDNRFYASVDRNSRVPAGVRYRFS